MVVATIGFVVAGAYLRASFAREWAWQCDELPLILRFTGICGIVHNETEARSFVPSLFTLRTGTLRSLRARPDIAALHTTIGFWANLGIHAFGCQPWAARVGPWCFSVLGIAAAGWGAWIVTRRTAPACVAATLVALSPHATFYAAQTRGYAEAYALAGLLMILLEYVRRRPHVWWLALATGGCAVYLSLALFTAWLYWVVPVLLAAWLFSAGPPDGDPDVVSNGASARAEARGSLPARHEARGSLPVRLFARRPLGGDCGAKGVRRLDALCPAGSRAVVSVIVLAVMSVMVIYSLDRWNTLTYVSTRGERTSALQDIVSLGVDACREMMPLHPVLGVMAALGAWRLFRREQRWWVEATAGSILVILGFVVIVGSPGYARNLGVLLVPLAVFVGVAVDGLGQAVRAVVPDTLAPLAGCATFLIAAAAGQARLEPAVRQLVLPDWGAFVQALNARPPAEGPRWICRDIANHWTIGWYAPGDPPAVEQAASGESFELVLGSQRGRDGAPIIFRPDRTASFVVEEALPGWLAAEEPEAVMGGVELRRWQARPVDEASATAAEPAAPMYAVIVGPNDEAQRRRFLLKSAAYDQAVVTFKPLPSGGSAAWEALAPARAMPALMAAMSELPACRLRVFGLSDRVAE